MTEDENKYIGQADEEESMPSSHEMMECKRVFVRKNVSAPDVDEAWEKMRTHMGEDAGEPVKKTRNFSVLIGFISGVAASVLFGIIGWQFFKSDFLPEPVQVFSAMNTSADGIVLSTSSGEMFVISDNQTDSMLMAKGVVATEDSLSYKQKTKDKDIQWVTLFTPRGKDYHVTLPDGSQVWLNAESRLEFPEQFNGEKRLIRLQGEGYFKVAKDEKHPFVVDCNYFTTTALGTEFNVKAYSPSDASTVLVTGKVALADQKHAKPHILSPGEKALWKDSHFEVSKVDTYGYVQWKEGYFYFDDVPLVEVLQGLGRWYNVDIIIKDSKLINTRMHFVAERSLDLKVALDNLNTLNIVHAEVENNQVVIG